MKVHNQYIFVLVHFVFCFIYNEGFNLTSYDLLNGKSRSRRQVSPFPLVIPVAQASVPCITCTYANRGGCCAYYRRCCGIISPAIAQTPTPGACPPSASSLYTCSQTCLVDEECNPGMKCCPPPPSVCVVPFAANQCPLSVSAEVYLRPCRGIPQSNGPIVSNCQTNEFCCPNPYSKGCCVIPNAIPNPNTSTAVG